MPKSTCVRPTQGPERRGYAVSSQENVYDNFSLLEDEIRILSLDPAPDLDDPVICSSEVFSLLETPAFDALSYTWGPPIEGIEIPDAYITLCGLQKQVRGNLFHALRRLRLEKECRRLWVDALCIDQANPIERSQQVARMARTFQAAEVVHIWLGEDFSEQGNDSAACMSWLREVHRYRACFKPLVSDRLFGVAERVVLGIDQLRRTRSMGCRENSEEDLVRAGSEAEKLLLLLRKELVWMRSVFRDKGDWPGNTARPEDLEDPYEQDIWNKLVSFFSKTYFRRRWVLQEIHHARYAEVWCGSETIAYRHMLPVFEIVGSLASGERVQRLRDACPVLSCLKQIRKHNTKGTGNLLRIFSQVSRSDCGDERDRIYALLGLVKQTALRPNYSLSTNETWIEVAKAGVQEGMAESLIRCAAMQARTGSRSEVARGLPSWVPDFGLELPNVVLGTKDETLQPDAWVDSQNRLTCNILCLGEVIFCNGWAVLKGATSDAAISKVMAAPAGPGDGSCGFTAYLTFAALFPMVLTVDKPSELKDRDLICRDVASLLLPRRRAFILRRAVKSIGHELGSREQQDWVVIGSPYSSMLEYDIVWDGVRSRRLRLI